MDQITKEYAIKAIKYRIAKLEEFITWQKNIERSAMDRLDRLEKGIKESKVDQWATMAIYEDSETKLLAKARERLAKAKPNLEKYRHALHTLERGGTD